MKRVAITIALASLFAAFYQLSPYVGVPARVIFGMCVLSPFLVLIMAFVILKYGKASEHTFEDRYYDDLDEAV